MGQVAAQCIDRIGGIDDDTSALEASYYLIDQAVVDIVRI
jgi:hypothetical protein